MRRFREAQAAPATPEKTAKTELGPRGAHLRLAAASAAAASSWVAPVALTPLVPSLTPSPSASPFASLCTLLLVLLWCARQHRVSGFWGIST